ncbi:MAG: bifunctional oligoribonuclease/PAP phosphatase NrnA [Rhodothermales bacterium]|nr:bifunctional oligoribonuclease/PAP phosphatase NrnA [Rhodothermales bacterium]MBO6780785.1 bifunctional oligoribonuclease/PAP phosphatase NrnA [Rhodothermales bacterium]
MLQEVCALIDRSERFVLTTHAKPDGDAIGSVLGFARYLQQKGKSATIITCDPPPFNLEWLHGALDIQVYDGSLRQMQAIADADVIAVMDLNAQNRMGPMGASVRNATATRLLIDHHTDPEGWFDLAYARESASSTGQLVYEIISADDPALIDHATAECLYTAIMTDTGSFRYSNVTPELHRAIAEILEYGRIDPSAIHTAIYDRKSEGSLKLLARLLQGLQIEWNGLVSYTVITNAMLQETGAHIEETEGYVNWGLAVEGVRITMLFTQTERGTKVSFRSRGDDHVHKWAQSLGGGGHPNASGAFVRKPLEETIEMVMAQAPRHLDMSDQDADQGLSDEDQEYLSMLQAGPGRRQA